MVLEFWIFGGFGRDFYATIGETVAIKMDFWMVLARCKKIWEKANSAKCLLRRFGRGEVFMHS